MRKVTEKDREEHCKTQLCPRCFFNSPDDCMISTWKTTRQDEPTPKGAMLRFKMK